ncbi:fasciclin domain-containing protein [Niabella ginsengisoli]|uniref:Fasciclin domain-containing protein n=1 Tax=Niabella ginsengisoli TaxID=522298 RepID=A0ABS9SN89_9BACT|nr:fasciclin domain-containing protein [Niabella ginsengisoli]MCH5599825.1 fasciclin domain-containing protein [Niabella ginsengisoli]
MKRFSIIIAVLIFLVGNYGCKRELSGARYDSTDEMQIMDYIDSREDLTIFKELIDYVKQRSLLKTAGSYTVFAPNNNAFAELFKTLSAQGQQVSSVKDLSAEFWINYFRYHLLNEKINSNEFELGPLPAPTAYNNKYLIADISDSYSAINLNNIATITESNIEFTNGFINVINNVLNPPVSSVYETLTKSGKYNTMLSIFEETGYSKYLKDSIITLFIESDEALARSNFDKQNIPNLEDWVKYHIIPDTSYFLNILSGKRFYSLYTKEAQSFKVDTYGNYFINETFPFNQTKALGIDRVCRNGIYHTLDTVLKIVEALPATIRFNLYPPGSPYGEQNVFTEAPASIVLNTGTQSYHQNKENKIVAFNAQQIGDYFWLTIPDVPVGKYRIRMIHRGAATRGKFLVIYKDVLVSENVNMGSNNGPFEEWNYLVYNNCGDITVTDRSDVTLNFAFAGFGSNNSPSYCCDMLMDMVELIPIN